MRKLALCLAALACAATFPATVLPAKADAVAGKKVMGMCQVCHGKDGIAKLPEAPNLAGQNEAYLVKALTEFKTGVRQNEQMTVVASGLSDENIADVAAYYASIQIVATVPK